MLEKSNIGVLGGFLSFFLVLEAAAASAQTVAVAPFEGRRSAAVERLVGRALSDRAEVVSRSDVRAAARRAGVSGTDAAGVEALASDVGAQIVVQGSVSGPRRRPPRGRRSRDGRNAKPRARARVSHPRPTAAYPLPGGVE